MDDPIPDGPYRPESYRKRVLLNVTNAVVEAGTAEGSDEGVLEIQEALAGICEAIAMIVAAGSIDKTAKDRRDTADLCRRLILTASNTIARRVEAGEELPWTMRLLGPLH